MASKEVDTYLACLHAAAIPSIAPWVAVQLQHGSNRTLHQPPHHGKAVLRCHRFTASAVNCILQRNGNATLAMSQYMCTP